MQDAKREIRRLARKEFPEAERVDIHPDITVSGEGVVPGRFNVDIILGTVGLPLQAVRQWNAEDGFHFILQGPPLAGITAAGHDPWDSARIERESQRIDEGFSGVDTVVLELTSDVKNEKQPTNYVCVGTILPTGLFSNALSQRVQVQIGSNPVNRVSLQVDSGSSVLWAQSRFQRSKPMPANRSVLDLTIAEAADFQRGTEQYEISYGSGKKVKFSLFQGVVSIGSLKTRQVFGAAEIAKDENMLPVGIIGLGFSRQDSPIPFHRTLVVQLKESGLIKRACFALVGPRAEPMGSVINERREKDRGWLIIGSLEDKYHNGITWCRALVERYRQWVVRLNKVTVNGVVICENQLALLDTGSSYIATNKANIDKVAGQIQGKVNRGGNLVYPTAALKQVSFLFGDTSEDSFFLNDEDLSLGPAGASSTDTKSPFIYLKSLDVGDKKDFWILGGIFIDNMVTVFDYTGDMRIGFASKSEVDPVTSDVAKL